MECGVRRLDQLTVDILEKFQRQLKADGYRPPQNPPPKGYTYKDAANKPNTLKNKMTVIRQLIRFAVKREMIVKDPAPGYYLPAPVKRQAYCYSGDDLRRLFAAIGAENVQHLDLFHFLRLTGLRSDELCWLLKNDVDFDRRCLLIRAKECAQKTGRHWRPKRGNPRVVPLALLLPPPSHNSNSHVACGYCPPPCRCHHRWMLSQANSLVSWLVPRLMWAQFRPRSYSPCGNTTPPAAEGKS